MPDPFIGQIMMFAGNFAPRGWALCNGQLLSITSNPGLFSILGTTYGGDGRTTFGLPDLRGRVSVHPGQGPGLTNRVLGQKGGVEQVTLTTAQIPSHAHTARATTDSADRPDPTGSVLAKAAAGATYKATAANVDMHSSAITSTGGGQSHQNMPPFQGINYIIALVGVFPSRN